MFTQATQRAPGRAKLAGLMLAAAVATAATGGLTSAVQAQPAMERMPVGIVTALLQAAFEGTTIRLNGYGSVNAPIVENDSVVRLGPRLGGRELRFSILPARSGRSPHHFYVSDINLRRITVSHEHTTFRVRLFFEEDGVELKGLCRGGVASGCVAGRDQSTPDVHIENFVIEVILIPGAVNGSLSFSRAGVRLLGEPQAGGVCRLGPDLCNALTHYKEKTRAHIEERLRSFLMQSGVRETIARATRPILDERGIRRVVFAQIRGSNLEIVHER